MTAIRRRQVKVAVGVLDPDCVEVGAPPPDKGMELTGVRRHRVSTSRIGLVPLEPDGGRLVAYLERRTPWDS